MTVRTTSWIWIMTRECREACSDFGAAPRPVRDPAKLPADTAATTICRAHSLCREHSQAMSWKSMCWSRWSSVTSGSLVAV